MSRLWHTDTHTHGNWKVGQYSAEAESAISDSRSVSLVMAVTIAIEVIKVKSRVNAVTLAAKGWSLEEESLERSQCNATHRSTIKVLPVLVAKEKMAVKCLPHCIACRLNGKESSAILCWLGCIVICPCCSNGKQNNFILLQRKVT